MEGCCVGSSSKHLEKYNMWYRTEKNVMWYKFSARPKKLYFYNGEDKPLIHHIEDIFPGANSVDIFYITEKVRALINGSQLSHEEILWNVEHRTVFPTKEHLKKSR